MSTTTHSILDPLFLKKLESLSLVSKKAHAGQIKGERRSTKRGSSVEFADFREYSMGDDLRYVDWKAYARLDKLFVKLFVEEEDLSLHLLIDTSQSMSFGTPMSKLDYARRTAAAIGYIALSEFDRLNVATFSSKLGQVMPPVRGKPGINRFLQFLHDKVQIGGETHLGDALTKYTAISKNVGIAIILSDFFDESSLAGIKALLTRRFQVVLIHILDEEELHPTFTGDLRLRDSETGEMREISVSPYLMAQYEERLQEFCGNLQKLASRHGADYVRTSTGVPFETVILQYLRTGGLIR